MATSKTLIFGSGGREDAIGWKIARSWHSGGVYVAAGNGGTGRFGIPVSLNPTDYKAAYTFCRQQHIDQVIIGPDNLVASGLADYLRLQDIPVVAPSQEAAKLESWKPYGKQFMDENNIPTAPWKSFSVYEEARKYLLEHGAPIVVKAAGLAQGKGVYPCKMLREAETVLFAVMIERIHGEAGREVVIEDFLEADGVGEFSAHALCNGENYIPFPPMQDHKTIGEGDTGLNTGGMGIAGPVFLSREESAHMHHVVGATLRGMQKRGVPYTGVLYPGSMQTRDGCMLLEYNARGGDPEMQAYMSFLESDGLQLFSACARGKLDEVSIRWQKGAVACITLAAAGYPGKPKTGDLITGIPEAERIPGVTVFCAGVKLDGTKLYTSGGRVLYVTAVGEGLSQALEHAYEAAKLIQYEGKYYRTDIGKRALAANEMSNYED